MSVPESKTRAKLAVFKFASCDGCQLQLIDIMDELQLLRRMLDHVEIAYFLEATSDIQEGPYDIGIVEGSISTHHQRERIREIREQCRFLVTIGACATSGGIQALRNWGDDEEILRSVYAKPEYIDSLKHSTAIADHVPVDFELRGCPINKTQLLEVLTANLNGKHPSIPTYSVCIECKRRGNICVTVARGEPCLGPVTQAGCGAICPAYDRGCYGCYGAMEQPNMPGQTNMMRALGMTPKQIGHAFRSYTHATEFDEVAGNLLDGEGAP